MKKAVTKGEKVLRFFKIFFAVILAIFLLTAVVNSVLINMNVNKVQSFQRLGSDLKFEDKGNGTWNIYSDEELKVLQITDVHLGGGWMSFGKDKKSLNAVASLITAEKPDLVVFSGDMAYPVPFQAGTFNNKSGAKLLAELMESLGVYWTATYGNHDTEAYSYFNREQITNFYSKYRHSLVRVGAQNVDGAANQVFNVVNSDGIITRMLFTVDSHSYVDGDIFGAQWKYDNIHENQITWYKNCINRANVLNKKAIVALEDEKSEKYSKLLKESIPSTVFVHVPLEEYKTAWNEYVNAGYKNTADVTYNYGVAGEEDKIVYHGVYPDNFFETMLEMGSTDTVFCGHDHLNNFSLNYKGINLSYSYSIDYLAYLGISKLGTQRGCTVITLGTNGEIDFKLENYYQDKYASPLGKEEVTMQKLGEQN